MKKFITLFMLAFMIICIFKTNSVEAASSVYFKIMSVDIQSGKSVVEGYFHNTGSSDGRITSVRFYGSLTQSSKLSSLSEPPEKICDVDVTFPDYKLILKPNHKAYETFVVLDKHFKKDDIPENSPYHVISLIQNWDVKCKVYFED